jgi:hypothetical protein
MTMLMSRKEPMFIGVGAIVLILAIIVLFMLFRGRSTI